MGLKNLLADPALDVGPEAVEAGLPKVVQQRLLQVRTLPAYQVRMVVTTVQALLLLRAMELYDAGQRSPILPTHATLSFCTVRMNSDMAC